jgi:hypothetical protein
MAGERDAGMGKAGRDMAEGAEASGRDAFRAVWDLGLPANREGGRPRGG